MRARPSAGVFSGMMESGRMKRESMSVSTMGSRASLYPPAMQVSPDSTAGSALARRAPAVGL